MVNNREMTERVHISGLTSAQITERRGQGLGNDVKLTTSRTNADILKTNLLNPVSLILLPIGIGLWLAGDINNAITTLGLVVFNTGIGIIQELRAKKQLDQIALLAQAKVTVIRNGSEQQIDPSELVQGDVLVIRAGDQIPVDGVITGEGRIEVDESALTGESDSVAKFTGDTVLSGSFCVIGESIIEGTGVGEKSFANAMAKNAREFKMEMTPLQKDVNFILRGLLLIVLFYSFLAVLSLFVQTQPLDSWLRVMSVITGAVSAGLLTMITLNYSWGAVKISQKGSLVQQIYAVESLSNVTVLCTDKTGTLTANKIVYNDVYAAGIDKSELKSALADFASSATTSNNTTEAIVAGLPGSRRSICDEVLFSSARKWSALVFDDAPDRHGAYVLGALEMLQDNLTIDAGAVAQLQQWSEAGLRVLVFARNLETKTFHAAGDEPMLPNLELIGVVSFSDELRPHLQETLAAFAANDVRLKVISGDNPQTVAALAKQAGLLADLQAVSGPELADMGPAEFAQTAQTATVFGRITPEQKEALVEALRDQGEYVAMIGDGVNDVLSLKKANMGIAMESGSTATRSVSDMILMNDSFEALPLALDEGYRIINSIQNILKLYLVKVLAMLLIIIAIEVPELGFPFTPAQNLVVSIFATSIPTFILAVAATSARQKATLFKSIIHFTIPAVLGVFLIGILIYVFAFLYMQPDAANETVTPEVSMLLEKYSGSDFNSLNENEIKSLTGRLYAQTALTTFFVFSGIILMLFAQPPLSWFVGGSPYNGNKTPLIAAIILLIVFFILMAIPSVRTFNELVQMPNWITALIAVATVVWMILQRAAWRANLFERFLGIDVPVDA